MKRSYVHVAVAERAPTVRFYSTVFGTPPAVLKDDYAKWMLEDPRVKFFAISTRGAAPGLDHLGLQVDSDEELAALDQPQAACCYAQSNKYWTTDPQGIAWETFHALASIPTYGEVRKEGGEAATSCCAPQAQAVAFVKRGGAKPACC